MLFYCLVYLIHLGLHSPPLLQAIQLNHHVSTVLYH